jgi:hypothetical protein
VRALHSGRKTLGLFGRLENRELFAEAFAVK